MERKLKKHLKNGKFENVSENVSKTMSKIRGKGNKTTEARFRAGLISAGIKGWNLHPKKIPIWHLSYV